MTCDRADILHVEGTAAAIQPLFVVLRTKLATEVPRNFRSDLR